MEDEEKQEGQADETPDTDNQNPQSNLAEPNTQEAN